MERARGYPLVFCYMPYEAARETVLRLLSEFLSRTKGRMVQVKATYLVKLYHGYKLGSRRKNNPNPLELAIVASVLKELLASRAIVSDGNGGRWRFVSAEKTKKGVYFTLQKVN
ncbi:MAG: hypothetical protein QXH81_09245 [Thermofilaceae archaeon]